MASQNKSLGKFKLNGIRRAPRGVPQIEVTFNIDTNGIVNVSAKDLDTGMRQEITITGSSNMSREDIDRAIRDAQQYAAEDGAIRDGTEKRQKAEQLLYQASAASKQKGIDKERKKQSSEAEKRLKKAMKNKNNLTELTSACDELERILG
jgi:molecular chaperone DnaK